jgi:hypothetical protein
MPSAAKSPARQRGTKAAAPVPRKALSPRSITNRSRVTNGGHFLPGGIDGRSATARRMYDIVAQVAADLGGADRLSETRLSLVRRFASLSAMLEEQEVHIARGETVDLSAFAHLSSTLCRLASRIGLKRVAKDITPTLAEYLRHDHDRPSPD